MGEGEGGKGEKIVAGVGFIAVLTGRPGLP
jgi:hypothetical protein